MDIEDILSAVSGDATIVVIFPGGDTESPEEDAGELGEGTAEDLMNSNWFSEAFWQAVFGPAGEVVAGGAGEEGEGGGGYPMELGQSRI